MTEAASIESMLTDLIAEQESLDGFVAALSPDHWALPTRSPGWTVSDQIGHLAFFDATATLAITDPEQFAAHAEGLNAVMSASNACDIDDATLAGYRELGSVDLLNSWRANRAALAESASALRDHDRVVWYGPTMGSKSFLTARLMETWAHGHDVVDALATAAVDAPERPDTDRLRHIALLGFLTRAWSYLIRGEEMPSTTVRVTVSAPSGDAWTFGPDDAPESIEGTASDFCRVVTQRSHVDDTDLSIAGVSARDWMLKAQAFAGRATIGPKPKINRNMR
jgi:uncharacterized protein (TIGR03084 family)